MIRLLLLCLLTTQLPAQPEEFIRGDVNDDGNVNTIDLIILIKHLTGGEPLNLDAADLDGDGDLDFVDALYLHNYLQGLGPEPSHPFPGCGLPSVPWDLT